MGYIVREIRDDELSASADVICRSFRAASEYYCLEQSVGEDFITVDRLRFEKDSGIAMYGAFFHSEEGELLVGFMSLDIRERSINLEKLGVLPEFRRMGIGTALVATAKDFCRRKLSEECYRKCAGTLRVGVIDESPALKRWYESIGFTPAGTVAYEHLPFAVYYMEYKV